MLILWLLFKCKAQLSLLTYHECKVFSISLCYLFYSPQKHLLIKIESSVQAHYSICKSISPIRRTIFTFRRIFYIRCKNIISNTNKKYYDNHWTFGNRITITDFSDNFIFHKNNVTEEWSRIESYNLNKNPYAIGTLDNSGLVISQDNGLYKLSQAPVPPDISAIQPYLGDEFKAQINLSGLMVEVQNKSLQSINFRIWEKKGSGDWVSKTDGFIASTQLEVDLEPQTTYFYKAQAVNSYGESWYSTEISFVTGSAEPTIIGLASES